MLVSEGNDDGVIETSLVAAEQDINLAYSTDGTTLVHGGANAIEMLDGRSFLATFHTVRPDGTYTNYAFEFSAEPPFRILRISLPLPLTSF